MKRLQTLTRVRVLAFVVLIVGRSVPAAQPWPRHMIDDSSRGADGVRLADVDADGHLDIVTGWEEGGVIRVYRHPGTDSVTATWPAVTVGQVNSAEDAVFTDLNLDGVPDVVSCCEGKTRDIFWHHTNGADVDFWDAQNWTTTALTDSVPAQAWMFCLPRNAGLSRSLIVVGSKGQNGSISRLSIDASDPSQVSVQPKRLCDAGWIMSLRNRDMDGDGDFDVLFTDRKGPLRGIAWLEQPADPDHEPWPRHVIGGTSEEVMFLDVGDLNGDGVDEIVAATRSAGVIVLTHDRRDQTWHEQKISMPPDCGTGKGVAIADIDADNVADLVLSCENAAGKHGVFWLSRSATRLTSDWEFHAISGVDEGIKFDRLETLDIDDDGDLDVLTCEERDNLGVIWYENPGN